MSEANKKPRFVDAASEIIIGNAFKELGKREYERLSNMPQYEEGMNACLGGMAKSFNHYPAGTDRHKAFDLGWTDTEKEMPK